MVHYFGLNCGMLEFFKYSTLFLFLFFGHNILEKMSMWFKWWDNFNENHRSLYVSWLDFIQSIQYNIQIIHSTIRSAKFWLLKLCRQSKNVLENCDSVDKFTPKNRWISKSSKILHGLWSWRGSTCKEIEFKKSGASIPLRRAFQDVCFQKT
jgi:hypothetical protein